MKSSTKLFLKAVLPVLVACGIFLIPVGPGSVVSSCDSSAEAATNAAFTLHRLTDLGNPRFGEHLYIFTQSSASPEAFSVGFPEFPSTMDWMYDEFDISYQTSTATGEWTEETVYTWVDTDASGYPDSLQATLTGCLAGYEVWVYARDIYGE